MCREMGEYHARLLETVRLERELTADVLDAVYDLAQE
jgi:hypothetical protein